MSSSTLIEVFGHIVFSFTRGVTEHYNPEEPEFTAEAFGYSPLESTGREWYYHPVDELIYQEYSDKEAVSLDYLASSRLDVKVVNACSPDENEETQENEDKAMAWKRLRPSALLTVCKSMYIGSLISLLTATLLGTLYMLISYLCYKTIHNCEYHDPQQPIPLQVQWLRTISGVILYVFIHLWYFAIILLLFRPFQLLGIKKKLTLVCCLIYCLDQVVYRVALQGLTKSTSHVSSALDKGPPNALFLISACLQTFFISKHFFSFSRKQKLTFFFQMAVPGCLCFLAGSEIVYFIYPAYNEQGDEGKLSIALFAPLIGVVLKLLSRILVQRLYNITHPGYSYVLLAPSYFGFAVIFRVLQADLDSLEFMAVLGIIHGASEVMERSTMVVVDHICHRLWKRTSVPWGSFRTPRRERLMADIAIMSMLSESIAIVAVNGLLYLYQFIYLQDKSLIDLLQSFAIQTSVQLVIEWFFTSLSLAIETRYQNLAVMAVWRRRWKRHILVAIVNVLPLAVWTSTNFLVILHARYNKSPYKPCKMPFT